MTTGMERLKGVSTRAKPSAERSGLAAVALPILASALCLGSCGSELKRQEPPSVFPVAPTGTDAKGACGIQAGQGEQPPIAAARSSNSGGAAFLAQQAANGSAVAELFLSRVYLKGVGVHADLGRSKALLQDAAQRGQPLAEALLGRNFVYGWDGFQKEPSKGLVLLKASALGGCSFAAAELGQIYTNGDSVDRDAAEGLVWYSLAASQNEPDGEVALGDHYYYGDDPKSEDDATPDYETALSWYRKAASSGSAAGEDALADLLSDAAFKGHDYQLAASTYESAAMSGDARAEYWLGELLSRTEWPGHDPSRAYQYYRLAALNDDDTWRSKAITAIYEMLDSVSPPVRQRFPPPPEPLNLRIGRYGHYMAQVFQWGLLALFAIPLTLAALSAAFHKLKGQRRDVAQPQP